MVKAGHMDAIDEIFEARRRRGEAVLAFEYEPPRKKDREQVFWEVAGGVVLGMCCVVSFTLLAAAL